MRLIPALFVLSVMTISPVRAQAQTAPVVMDLMKDADAVGKKMIALAKAIPADKYDWRPAAGVRSINEVIRHVASDNYLLPTGFGVTSDASIGITSDYNTAVAFEARKVSREQTIADLEKSFAHLASAMSKTTAAQLPTTVKFFGQDFTQQALWITTTTHMHEHLGQLIAYARSNGVTPPWSK